MGCRRIIPYIIKYLFIAWLILVALWIGRAAETLPVMAYVHWAAVRGRDGRRKDEGEREKGGGVAEQLLPFVFIFVRFCVFAFSHEAGIKSYGSPSHVRGYDHDADGGHRWHPQTADVCDMALLRQRCFTKYLEDVHAQAHDARVDGRGL